MPHLLRSTMVAGDSVAKALRVIRSCKQLPALLKSYKVGGHVRQAQWHSQRCPILPVNCDLPYSEVQDGSVATTCMRPAMKKVKLGEIEGSSPVDRGLGYACCTQLRGKPFFEVPRDPEY